MTINKKDEEIKRKHHHVWAHYMKKWSPNNKIIYYTTQKDKNIIREVSVKGINVVEGFYNLNTLTDKHIEYILALISPLSIDLQILHHRLLEKVVFLQRGCKHLLFTENSFLSEEIKKHHRVLKCNSFENIYSNMESKSRNIIDQLAARNLSILNEQNMMTFMYFLAHQFTRTKSFKEKILTSMHINSENNKAIKEMIEHFEDIWCFVAYIYGINIGYSNYSWRNIESHTLLINDTKMPFITSDQPVINIHQGLNEEKVTPPSSEEYDMFYPISPSVAYLIHKSNRFPRGKFELSECIVDELNIKVARNANLHIIGNSEESLKPYCKHVGSRMNAIKNKEII